MNQLVRDFFIVVLSSRATFHEDRNSEKAEETIADASHRYAKVFMGENDAYVAQPWNASSRLGLFLRVMVSEVGDYASPAVAYFNFLAVQALRASISSEAGEMTDEEVQEEMTLVVNDAIAVLLGTKAGAQL